MRTQNYSRKRQAIYELLLSTDIHPSADWIYNTLKPAYPDLSLGTVYRNLKVLEEKRIVKSVAVVGGSERYDARMSVHSHFVCRCCGRVEDVFHREELSELIGRVNLGIDNEVESYNLIFYGVCSQCRS